MTAEQRQNSPSEEVVWSCVEDGFYVASCADRFLGFVDRVEADSFQVCDARSQQIGLFKSLEAAMTRLTTSARTAEASAIEKSEDTGFVS